MMKWVMATVAASALQANHLREDVAESFLTLVRAGVQEKTFIEEGKDRITFSGGTHFLFGNGVFEKSPNDEVSEQEIGETVARFKKEGIPFTWWSSNRNLEKHGLQSGGEIRVMTLNTEQFAQHLDGVDVRKTRTDKEFADFELVMASLIGETLSAELQVAFVNACKAGTIEHFVAYVDGEIAGCVTLIPAKHSAGIWNLATLEKFRGQGIGTALTVAAINEAKRRGYMTTIALLTPDSMATGIFSRLQFLEATKYPIFLSM